MKTNFEDVEMADGPYGSIDIYLKSDRLTIIANCNDYEWAQHIVKSVNALNANRRHLHEMKENILAHYEEENAIIG